MPSDVQICNMALSHIGSDATISSIQPADGTVEAGYCATFYPIALGLLLEAHTWTFARTRAALAVVNNPSTSWGYAYGLPGDCLKPRQVLQATSLTGWGFTDFSRSVTWDEQQVFDEHGGANFQIETDRDTGAKILLTNEPGAVLLYTRLVSDTTQFPYRFVMALSYLVAAYIAGPIIKGQPGASAGQQYQNAVFGAGGLLAQAKEDDANTGKETVSHVPPHIRVR